jgi:UDP-glucose 4-epimerase
MAAYLVTGGAGFIGSHIVEELLELGEQVRVLDNFSTGKRENIEPFLGRIELIEGDLRDPDKVKEAVSGAEYVLHQAALASVQRSVRDPVMTDAVNVGGTVKLLTAAKKARVKRVIFASSSSVYGDTPVLPKTETMLPNPLSPYAASKLAGEHYCRAFYRVFGLETVVLRYFNIFGPRQDPSSPYAAVIPLFLEALLGGEQPTVFGDGLQSRDFTYVANAVRANLLAIQAPEAAGKIFNIACGERHSLLDLVQNLNEILRKKIAPRFAEARTGDVKHSLADISQARLGLGYEPRVGFAEGLRRTAEWLEKNLP